MSWRQEVKASPILFVFDACFVVEATMAVFYGVAKAGGWTVGPLAWVAGFIMLILMLAGRWIATRMCAVRGQSWSDEAAWAKRAGFFAVLAVPLVLAQLSGWGMIETLWADGLVKRDVEATTHDVAGEALKKARDERSSLGVQPAASEIQAQIEAVWAGYYKGQGTVGIASDNCKNPGMAPTSCKKVADLRLLLARADRAAALDVIIAQKSGDYSHSPLVSKGAVDVDILHRLSGVSPHRIRVGTEMLMVGIITFFSTFGGALVGQGRTPDAPDQSPEPQPEPQPMPHWDIRNQRQALAAPAPDAPPAPQVYAPAQYQQAPQQAAWHQLMPPQGPAGHSGAPATGSAQAHGAPINIHFGAVPGVSAAAPMAAAQILPQAPLSAPPQVFTAEQTEVIPPRHFSPAPPDRPSDSTFARQVLDGLVAFRAASLADSEGSVVPIGDMYARYAEWAGPRAIDVLAFRALMTPATGVHIMQLGGVDHYVGVSLRQAPRLTAVA